MSYQKLTQEERIIELMQDEKIVTAKQIQQWTGYNISSIKRTLKTKRIFIEVCPGAYKLNKLSTT